MSAMSSMKDWCIVISIVGLLIVGVGITLRSGLVESSREQKSGIAGNLSRLVVALAGYGAFLSMIQHLVGYKLGFMP